MSCFCCSLKRLFVRAGRLDLSAFPGIAYSQVFSSVLISHVELSGFACLLLIIATESLTIPMFAFVVG